MPRVLPQPRQNLARRSKHIARMLSTIRLMDGSAEKDCLGDVLALRRMDAVQEEAAARRWFEDRDQEALHELALSSLSFQVPGIAKVDLFRDDVLDQIHEIYLDTVEVITRMDGYDPKTFRTRANFTARHAAIRVLYRAASPAVDALAPPKLRGFAYLFGNDVEHLDDADFDRIAVARNFPLRRLDYARRYMTSGVEIDIEQYEDANAGSDQVDTAIDSARLPEIVDSVLDERAASIIRAVYLAEDPAEPADLADQWGVTVERIRQILRESYADLRDHLEGRKTRTTKRAERDARIEHERKEKEKRDRIRARIANLSPERAAAEKAKLRAQKQAQQRTRRLSNARALKDAVERKFA